MFFVASLEPYRLCVLLGMNEVEKGRVVCAGSEQSREMTGEASKEQSPNRIN